MTDNTKTRYQQTRAAAMKIVSDVGIVAYHDLDDDGRKAARQQMQQRLQSETGCAYETARRHIAKALRRHRSPDVTSPDAWGGDRRSKSSLIVELGKQSDQLSADLDALNDIIEAEYQGIVTTEAGRVVDSRHYDLSLKFIQLSEADKALREAMGKLPTD